MNLLTSKNLFDPFKWNLFLAKVNNSSNIKLTSQLVNFDVNTGKKCIICNHVLPLYSFRTCECSNGGLRNVCKKCTLDKANPFKILYNHMVSHSKDRKHEPPSFTVEEFQNIICKEPFCAISGCLYKEKSGDRDPFNLSPERILNSSGYTLKNTIPIIQCLQISYFDMSPEEIRRKILLFRDDKFVFNESDFLESLQPKKIKLENTITLDFIGALLKKRKLSEIETNVDCKNCNTCQISQSLNNFGKKGDKLNGKCKSCVCLSRNTAKNSINILVDRARLKAKKRGSIKSRNDTSHEVDANLYDLVIALFIKQKGRCSLSDIPFCFNIQENNYHKMSLDRLDNYRGYVDGNLQLIISPLNTSTRPSREEFEFIRDSCRSKFYTSKPSNFFFTNSTTINIPTRSIS